MATLKLVTQPTFKLAIVADETSRVTFSFEPTGELTVLASPVTAAVYDETNRAFTIVSTTTISDSETYYEINSNFTIVSITDISDSEVYYEINSTFTIVTVVLESEVVSGSEGLSFTIVSSLTETDAIPSCLTDNFNRSNEYLNASSDWDLLASSWNDAQIVSNEVVFGRSYGAWGWYKYTTDLSNSDMNISAEAKQGKSGRFE